MCKSTGSLILKQYRRGKNRRSRDLLKVWKKKRKSFVTSFISYCSSCAPFQFVLQPLQGSQGWKPMKGPTSINHRLRPSKVPLSKPSESHHLQGCCYCINSSGKWKQIFFPRSYWNHKSWRDTRCVVNLREKENTLFTDHHHHHLLSKDLMIRDARGRKEVIVM